jgi:putative Ca2+/H+ antiporter (TMEM165/GDT1 family)
MSWPILAGVLAATLATAAGRVGVWFGEFLRPSLLDTVVGASMLGMALWTLKPALPANAPKLGRRDAFLSTLIAFLIAEIGDQTQMPLWHAPPAMPIWARTRLGVVSIRALLR